MKPVVDGTSSDEEEADVDVSEPVTKKHKRHKHKKHKKKKIESGKKTKTTPEPVTKTKSPASNTSPGSSKSSSSALKLMIKYNEREEQETTKQTKKTEIVESPVQKYVDKIGKGLDLVSSLPMASISSKSPKGKKKSQKKDSETSSEEERWLDAIQSGKLEEVDEELKKIKPKDPKLMTARQRAMLERKSDKDISEPLMSLPSGYKEVVMTAEDIQRKAIKSQKRKQLADEKREKDKKKTMERLLKKQDSKMIKLGSKRPSKKLIPQITYKITMTGSSILLPAGVKFPLVAGVVSEKPPVVKCSVPGCKNVKKYCCSKTDVPLCSLACYKQNLAKVEAMTRSR